MIKSDRSPHLTLAHKYWKELLKSSDRAIDATCGNGYDTLFLSGICSVIGIDIQEQAIQRTADLLASHQRRAALYQLSHAEIDRIESMGSIRLIVYNLGYLPGGDKSITTQTETTLQSLAKGFALLMQGGALCVTCYPGHSEGAREELAVAEWASRLSSQQALVCHHKWVNRPGSPSLFWIVKS